MDLILLKYISNTHHTDVQHIHTNKYTYNTRKKDGGIYIYIRNNYDESNYIINMYECIFNGID